MKLFVLFSLLFIANGQDVPSLEFPSTVCLTPAYFNPQAVIKVDFSSGYLGPCSKLFVTSSQFVKIDWTSVTCKSFNSPEQQKIVSQVSGCCTDGLTVCNSSPEINL